MAETRTIEQRRDYLNSYRAKVRQKIKEYKLSKGCNKCGYNKNPNALQFHHTDRNKEYQVARPGTRCWKTVKKEIDKCIILCANCHAEEHYPFQG